MRGLVFNNWPKSLDLKITFCQFIQLSEIDR